VTEADLSKAATQIARSWGFERNPKRWQFWKRWLPMTDEQISDFFKPETAHPKGS
jgi:hypothetical protein